MSLSVDTPSRPRLILVIALLGIAATTFPITVFAAALPAVADALDTTDSAISWVIAAPLIALAVATPIAGKLGDLYGHRRTYLIGFGAATVLTLVSALAWNAGSLIAFRTLAQATGAATGAAGMALVMTVFVAERRAKALGYWIAVAALSPTVGVVVGGPLIDAFGWRVVFIIQAVLQTAAFLAAVPVLPETTRKATVRFDASGAIALGAGVTLGLLAINRGPVWGWSSPVVIAGLVASPLALWLFARIERRAPEPILPLEFFKRPGFSMPITTQALSSASYMGTYVIAPFLLQRLFGFGTALVALLVLPRVLLFAIAGWRGGEEGSRRGLPVVIVTGVSVLAFSTVITGLGARFELLPVVVIGFAISGLGFGFGRASIAASAGNAVPEADLGVASGAVNAAMQIGAAAGITLLTAFVGDATSGTRFMWAFVLAGVVALASVAATLLLSGEDG